MPVKTIIKASDTEVIVKVAGNDTANVTISLATDLLPYTTIQDGVGNMTITSGTTGVTATGLSAAVHVNAKIYTSGGTYVGTIQSVTNATTAVLAANALTGISNAAFKISYAVQVVSGTPAATIIGAQWAGEPGAVYRITRNSVRVMSLLADNGNSIDFMGTIFPPDNINQTSDIVVNIADSVGTGAKQGELWLRLRKVDGYVSKIDTAQFGIYDNVLVSGS